MDKDIISNIKSLGIDMIHRAGSGHPGIVLGAAPIIYTLFAYHLNINVNDPQWINRDRFVMSAGHGSALLYATMFMAGYPLTIDDLKSFRKIHSKTPGHPEYGLTSGVEMSTGPLGQGIASAVGMALGGKILETRYQLHPLAKKKQTRKMLDHRVYVLCGDGDLMEGVSYEACSFAGSHNLDNLIVLYDSNQVSLDGGTEHTFTENTRERFHAMGWHTEFVKDGEDVHEISRAIEKAKESGKPSFIEIRTVIGRGSLDEGTNKVHGKPLSNEDIAQWKASLNLTNEEFSYSSALQTEFQRLIVAHSRAKYDGWASEYREFTADKAIEKDDEFNFIFGKPISVDLLKYEWDFRSIEAEPLRNTNQTIMTDIAKLVPNFIGGSADLASSTNAYLLGQKDISKKDYNGRNIWFGVREHGMAAILNGLALSNFRPFGSTFLTFADYLKPAMRMSALMKLPVTYIFTHDSIEIGSDGPTHQPVEQLAMLRSIPNMTVFRPADAREIVGAWNYILNQNMPVSLVISKTSVPVLSTTNASNVARGAYVIRKETDKLNGIIIATGTEVHTAMKIAERLAQEKIDCRVVSMPSRELFLRQDKEYQEEVLPIGYKKVVIEAGSSFGWHQFVYNEKYLITVNEFGASGSPQDVLKEKGFDEETIYGRVRKLLR